MTPYRILIVEDQLIVQMHLQRIVEDTGHVVVGTAINTDEALRTAQMERPDLVLMDIHLADDSDGVETAHRLREQCDCAVVFVTAYADRDTVHRTAAVGAAGYVVKPFTDTQVHAAIVTAMVGHTMLQQTRARERALTAALCDSGEAVMLSDANGVVTFANQVAASLTGRTIDELRGLGLVEALGCTADESTVRSCLERSLERATRKSLKHVAAVRRGGAALSLALEMEPLVAAESGGAKVIVTLRQAAGSG